MVAYSGVSILSKISKVSILMKPPSEFSKICLGYKNQVNYSPYCCEKNFILIKLKPIVSNVIILASARWMMKCAFNAMASVVVFQFDQSYFWYDSTRIQMIQAKTNSNQSWIWFKPRLDVQLIISTWNTNHYRFTTRVIIEAKMYFTKNKVVN